MRASFFSFFLYIFFFVSLSEGAVVSCEMEGGLGNQLFQVATTMALAWDRGLVPVFPKLQSSHSLFAPRDVYWDTVFHRVQTKDPKEIEKLPRYQEPGDGFYYIPQGSYSFKIAGYWQSPKYFEHHRKEILSLFAPTEEIKEHVEALFSLLVPGQGPTVSVHLRRGDYLFIDSSLHLWADQHKKYYQRAIERFSKDAVFVVFSDDPEYAKLFFSENFPQKKAVFPQDKDYIELYLMARCDHAIIANSTFSWWGAYLNDNPHKIVIAPLEWSIVNYRATYRPSFLPTEWIKISAIQ